MAATKNKAWSGRNNTVPQKKHLVLQHKKQADKAKIRSMTPENVQEYLEDMHLDFYKYKKFTCRLMFLILFCFNV